MIQMPPCPSCKGQLLETKTEKSDLPFPILSIRCLECNFEDHLWHSCDEGVYTCSFLGKKKEVAA